MKWLVMIVIGFFAYLSGYFYGHKANLKDLQQRQMASDGPATPQVNPDSGVDSSH